MECLRRREDRPKLFGIRLRGQRVVVSAPNDFLGIAALDRGLDERSESLSVSGDERVPKAVMELEVVQSEVLPDRGNVTLGVFREQLSTVLGQPRCEVWLNGDVSSFTGLRYISHKVDDSVVQPNSVRLLGESLGFTVM